MLAQDSTFMQDGIITAVARCPITIQRRPAVDIDIKKAGVARASFTPSSQCPERSKAYSKELSYLTVLQQHVNFFDKDNDRVIWPLDTFYGFHQIGFNVVLALVSMLVIHFGFSYSTNPSWIPDPFFRIYIDNIHKAKHGSDSGTYDTEGRWVPQNFENIFSKYGAIYTFPPSPDPSLNDSPSMSECLRPRNLAALHKGDRNVMDLFGWAAAAFELFASWWMKSNCEQFKHFGPAPPAMPKAVGPALRYQLPADRCHGEPTG